MHIPDKQYIIQVKNENIFGRDITHAGIYLGRELGRNAASYSAKPQRLGDFAQARYHVQNEVDPSGPC